MSTPDTEYARNKLNKTYLRLAYGKSDIQKTKKEVDDILNEIITSRDTYWKERVRKGVEEMAGKTVWNVEGKPHISAHDLLQALDNLK